MLLRSLIEKLRRSVRREGLRGTLARIPLRLWAFVYERKRLIVLLKELGDVEPSRSEGDDLRVEDLARRHLSALAELNRERAWLDADARFEADVEAGYGGLVAFRGSELIACYWWVDRDMPPPASRASIGAAIDVLGLGIELEPGDAYGADLYVRESARGRGTTNAFLDRVEATLRERGYRRVWGYVEDGNRPARWTYSLRGYQPTWAVVRTRTLRRQRSGIEPVTEER